VIFKKRNTKRTYERLTDEASFDVSLSARQGLDKALGDIEHQTRVSGKEPSPKEELQHYSSISDEYGRQRQDTLDERTNEAHERDEWQLRNAQMRKLRVLMITRERDLLEDGSEAQERIISYGEVFDELHVVVLTTKEDGAQGIVKFGDNTWIYSTNSRSRLFAPYDAYQLARSQLVFASGFRADIIISHAPFEEGLVGHVLSKKYKRTHLIEVVEDPYDPFFLSKDDLNGWRRWVMRYVLPRAKCVRTDHERLRNKITRRYTDLQERTIALPYFQDLVFWRDTEASFRLKERYSQFSFIILVVAPLRKEQRIERIIEAAAPLLGRYASVGMVIVGDGALKKELENSVLERGIKGSVVLETDQQVTVSHMKTADVFLNMGSEQENDLALMKAAAAGLPVISVESEYAKALIEDEKSGYLCGKDDIECFQARLNEFLNKNNIRGVFAEHAQERVFTHFAKSKDTYYRSFAQMCEECVLSNVRE